MKQNNSDASKSKLVPVYDVVYFSGESSSGTELWKSDGTVSGTILVKDIFPGSQYNYNYGLRANSSNPTNLTNLNGTLFFAATDSAGGRELWKSNGTVAGTVMVKDIHQGSEYYYPYGIYSSTPSAIMARNGKLHFLATDSTGMRFRSSPSVF